ncbi:alpha/beta fold hydrolase [Streptomyces sp. NPDC002144]
MQPLTPVDHKVKHKSTIPANVDVEIELFVREYKKATGPAGTPKPVLMLHGRSVPALPGFDLVLPPKGGSPNPDTSYSWAQFLAGKGYDVYIMDLQGSGLSPRPKMDEPCNANPAQRGLLETNPGTGTCSPTAPYPHQLGNSQSEWDELATVVKFIRERCDNEKVSFIGWSAASFVMGRTRCSIPGTWRACSSSRPSSLRPAVGRRTPRHPSLHLQARACRLSLSPSRPRSSVSR